MAYSNITNVREEAGFTGNSNVVDSKITAYLNAANSHVDGVLGRLYSVPLASTPSVVELIERKLAAGHLLLDEYGEQAEGTSKDGNEKVKWAEDMLDAIQKGLVELRDTSGNLLTQNTRITMAGWPDSSAGTDKTDQGTKDDPPIFEIGEKF